MKILILLSIISCALGFSYANAPPKELPIGTTFSIKDAFWVYEVRGLFPRSGEARYLIQTSTGGGIGSDKYKYVSTFPAGTHLEVVALTKKSKHQWLYTVKAIGYKNPKIGDVPVVIAAGSMLEEPWRRPRGSYRPTQRIRLDPDLFTDFVYPEE